MKKVNILLVFVFVSMLTNGQKKQVFGTADYVRAMKHATDVMVNDVATPVAASRYYAYISLAANEAASLFNNDNSGLNQQIKNYKAPSIPGEMIMRSDAGLAIILALYESGSKFLPSGYLLKKNVDSLKAVAAKRKIKQSTIDATAEVVQAVVQATVSYAYTDGFVKLSGLKRFTPASGDEYWQPTPPGFMSAIEPYWNTLRPFLIDSASQFFVHPPAGYSKDSTSEFYKQMMNVYNTTIHLTKEQELAAMFWDCNPFALQQMGHLEFGIKKISPGGHWIGITGIACKKSKASLYNTAYTHALVSTSLADAFIACWNTKYKYNRIRPETAIKRLVNRNWNPLLQTPPFPEYTSGHSVVSATCAKILTDVFGDNFSFTDDTEKEFGLPVRRFRSFNEAAQEAAISRLYGGIHFMDAIESGRKEGELIATHILKKVPDPSQVNASGKTNSNE